MAKDLDRMVWDQFLGTEDDEALWRQGELGVSQRTYAPPPSGRELEREIAARKMDSAPRRSFREAFIDPIVGRVQPEGEYLPRRSFADAFGAGAFRHTPQEWSRTPADMAPSPIPRRPSGGFAPPAADEVAKELGPHSELQAMMGAGEYTYDPGDVSYPRTPYTHDPGDVTYPRRPESSGKYEGSAARGAQWLVDRSQRGWLAGRAKSNRETLESQRRNSRSWEPHMSRREENRRERAAAREHQERMASVLQNADITKQTKLMDHAHKLEIDKLNDAYEKNVNIQKGKFNHETKMFDKELKAAAEKTMAQLKAGNKQAAMDLIGEAIVAASSSGAWSEVTALLGHAGFGDVLPLIVASKMRLQAMTMEAGAERDAIVNRYKEMVESFELDNA